MAETKQTDTTENKEFAVIESGGKQYVVSVGDILSVEKLPGEHKKGDKVVFDKVLLVDNGKDTKLGAPYITGTTVQALFEENGREKKVRVARYRSKGGPNNSRVYGHRQPFSKVKISAIG